LADNLTGEPRHFYKLDFGKFSVNKGVLPFPTFVTVEKRKKKEKRKEEKKETSKKGNRNTLQWTMTIHHDPLQGDAFSVGGVAVLIPKDSTCTPLPAPTCRLLCNRNQL
jgi:hypothetical protein